MARDDERDDEDESVIAPTEEISQEDRNAARAATAPAEREPWDPPAKIDEYELRGPLGSGGMGRVYEYWDTKLERPVAIKFVHEPSRERTARLLDEARAAARIKHSSVVIIYRVGDVDGIPYIVSERLEGRLEPLRPWHRALDKAINLARGLDAAHKRGVIHGDIKPANAMVDAHGQAKLIDFGLARQVSPTSEPREVLDASDAGASGHDTQSVSRVYGTPGYMAPELVRGGHTDERTDVYAFGAMLHEMCTGELPRPADDSFTTIDPGLAEVVRKCMAREPEQRYASVASLLEALEKLNSPETISRENPYQWLRPFEFEHRALFFGRNTEIWNVLEQLRDDRLRLVILTGGSGVGKSSLARAGVLPRVAHGLGEDREWRPCTLVPGARPITSLCQALGARLSVDEKELAEELRAGDFVKLRRRLRCFHDDKRGTVLFVDQLEELVILASEQDATIVGRFLASLVVERTPGLRVLATARLDYLSRLTHLPGLVALVDGAVRIVPPLGRDAARECIEAPARLMGVAFESDELVDELADTTAQSEGALPLLQFTLAQLWEKRDTERAVITSGALGELGGVAGALARHADQVMAGLSSEVQQAARSVLLRMVTSEGTRARMPRYELVDGDQTRSDALEALIRGRLVATGEAEGESVCEIAHEALLTAWPQLKQCLDEDGGIRVALARLEQGAREWENMGRDREKLLRARELHNAEQLDLEHMSGRAREFLAASRRTVTRARWLRRLAILMPVMVAAVVYGVVHVVQSRNLDRRVGREIDKARASLAEARRALEDFRKNRDDVRTALLTLDHTGLIPADARDKAEQAWAHALKNEREAENSLRSASTSLERALGLAPGRASTRELIARVLDERAVFAHERHLHEEWEELVARLQLYDTELHASWRQPITVQVDTEPPGAVVEIRSASIGMTDETTIEERSPFQKALAPGSHVLTVKQDGEHLEVRYPLHVAPRAEAMDIVIARPEKARPAALQGLVYVPEGDFFFGYSSGRASEMMRPFFETVPVHERRTDAFWIAPHETTYADWIEFLDACWPDRCAGIAPALPTATEDNIGYRIELLRADTGEWLFEAQPDPDGEPLRARYGDTLEYPAREDAREQDWRNFPVTGLTRRDIQAYLDWRARPNHERSLPGARLCRDDEWERAARGADTRLYPHGNVLHSHEANIDTTYGKKPGTSGPDEVGSYGDSDSVFGLHDMSGNVWEMTTPIFQDEHTVRIRGGSYAQDLHSAAVVNRWSLPHEYKDSRTGFRVCTSLDAR